MPGNQGATKTSIQRDAEAKRLEKVRAAAAAAMKKNEEMAAAEAAKSGLPQYEAPVKKEGSERYAEGQVEATGHARDAGGLTDEEKAARLDKIKNAARRASGAVAEQATSFAARGSPLAQVAAHAGREVATGENPKYSHTPFGLRQAKQMEEGYESLSRASDVYTARDGKPLKSSSFGLDEETHGKIVPKASAAVRRVETSEAAKHEEPAAYRQKAAQEQEESPEAREERLAKMKAAARAALAKVGGK